MDVRAMSQLAGAAPVEPLAPAAPALRAADDLVVEEFDSAIRPDASATEPGRQPKAAPAAVGGKSLGDAILAGIEDVAGQSMASWREVQNGLNRSTGFTTAEVINFQGQVIQFGFLYEVVGKAVSKAAQNIDSLVKLQ